MPTPTYTALATYTVGAGGDSEVVFASIPNTFKDLVLIISARSNTTGGTDTGFIQFNSDTGNNYFGVSMSARTSSPTEASASMTRFDTGRMATSANGATNFSVNIIDINDYASTSIHKVGIIKGNSHNQDVEPVTVATGRWASTNAITSISIKLVIGTAFVQNSTFSLYGIAG